MILGLAVALFLPLFTALAAERLQHKLMERAEVSPLLIGHSGNEVDLTLSSLYFRSSVRTPIPMGLRHRLGPSLGVALPLHIRHSIGGEPLVGTGPEYFSERGLRLAAGRLPVRIGEVVAGARLADELRLEVGHQVRSDLSNLYNLSGSYPLLLDVVGFFETAGSPDDEVWWTDIKTTWALDGLFHGHEEVTEDNSVAADMIAPTELDNPLPEPLDTATDADSEAPTESLASTESTVGTAEATTGEQDNLEASAALFLFTEITDKNRSTFHLHGSPDEAPVTAFLFLPKTRQSHDLVLGDFAIDPLYQAVRPPKVVRSLLDIVLRVRQALRAYFGLVAFSTGSFFLLALVLSYRLRRDELRLMARLGCDRLTLAGMVAAEVTLTLVAAGLVCGAALWLGMRWMMLSF